MHQSVPSHGKGDASQVFHGKPSPLVQMEPEGINPWRYSGRSHWAMRGRPRAKGPWWAVDTFPRSGTWPPSLRRATEMRG
jgi:hypothetical protein